MNDGLTHPAKEVIVKLAVGAGADNSRYSAHLSALSNHCCSIDSGRLGRSKGNPFETVVAIFSRVAFPAIGGGQDGIDHLPRRKKVKYFRPIVRALDQLAQKTLHRLSQH